ncbi:nucleotidyltransferase domain-containing protein [Bacillus chungangensis]|uniref:Aminoglycoside adenylyltransferase n=1 Tax=Bacillus chungangensis TaxID=587633 RepID=A0ABT9WTC9_9BACI|nr:hypothetical protein [Bacillus chungangensis]MDQ0176474.1 hypothetical protein [Bacillus chungangensis]
MLFKECHRIAELMSAFTKPWFFAGGWAIDLFVGQETRKHQDIEISLFRKDQRHIRNYLPDWEFKKVIKGEFYEWEDEFLALPIHEIHAENKKSGQKIEMLLNECQNSKWIFRRNKSITYPCNSIWSYTDSGMPYLQPEIALSHI